MTSSWILKVPLNKLIMSIILFLILVTTDRLKSSVTKKKGRGFSSVDTENGLEGVSCFDVLSQDNVGNAQKCIHLTL